MPASHNNILPRLHKTAQNGVRIHILPRNNLGLLKELAGNRTLAGNNSPPTALHPAGKHDIFSRIKFAALNRPLYRKSPSRMDFSAADHTSMYKDIPVKIDIAGQHIYILIDLKEILDRDPVVLHLDPAADRRHIGTLVLRGTKTLALDLRQIPAVFRLDNPPGQIPSVLPLCRRYVTGNNRSLLHRRDICHRPVINRTVGQDFRLLVCFHVK